MRVKKAKALSNLAEAGEGPIGGLANSLEAYGELHMGCVQRRGLAADALTL